MKKLRKNYVTLVLWSVVIISILLIAFTVRSILLSFRILSITGQSMEPTYKNGAIVLSFKTSASYSPKVGQIITYHSKTSNNLLLIQRVIGVAGDIIEIRDGEILKNNHVIQEPYLEPDTKTLKQVESSSDTMKLQISKNHLYLLGDNRSNSYDSRIQGEISIDDVESVVLFCIARCH